MLKKIDRLKYMDYLIRIGGTGNLEQFAKKLSISRSTCGEYIRLLRDLGATIQFSRHKNTYKYEIPIIFFIGYQNPDEQ